MATKKDGTRGGLVRRKKSLERLIDLKTRRLGRAMADRMDSLMLRTLADMPDSDLDCVAELMMKVMPQVVGHVVAEERPPAHRAAEEAQGGPGRGTGRHGMIRNSVGIVYILWRNY